MPAPALAGEIVPGFFTSTVVSGLDAPTALTFLPDGRLLVTEQGGRIVLVEDSAASTVGTIPVAVCSGGEMGLLGIAVDPGFAANGFVYLYRTAPPPHGCGSAEGRGNDIVRVAMGEDGTIVEGSLTTILAGIRALTGVHNGGGLRVGPDGKLYLGVGDNGVGDVGGPPGHSTNPFAQDLGALEGKILRVNRDGSVPADNPFVGQEGKRPEIFAYGFRNPWRSGFDPETGRLWVGDVGEETIEEIDVVTAGGNYGWPICEGTFPAGCESAPGLVPPALGYSHDDENTLGHAVIGGDFAPAGFGPHGGDYFFGDLTGGAIYRARLDQDRDGVIEPVKLFLREEIAPVDIQFGPDGALYYLTYQGEVRKVVGISSGEQLVSGERLRLKGGRKKEVSASSRDAIDVAPAIDDPTVIGASVRIVGNGFDDIYALPPENWRYVGGIFRFEGFEYRDIGRKQSPITNVLLLRSRRLKISGAGPGLRHVIEAIDPSPVDIVLTAGTKRFCMSFGGQARLREGQEFTARNAPSPSRCRD